MSETSELLRLFRVEKQLRGLRSRLSGAERFLNVQQKQLDAVEAELTAIDDQIKHARATSANEEGEAERLDARVAELREKMNNTKTAKEYTALLTELNTYKESKSEVEDRAIDFMSKIDTLTESRVALAEQQAERAKIVERARADCKSREAEIKERVEELTKERDELSATLTEPSRRLLEQQIDRHGDEAMSPVEVIDRRNKEFSCGACMMAIPIETVSAVLSGRLTQCVSCHCILFAEEDLLEKPKRKKATAET